MRKLMSQKSSKMRFFVRRFFKGHTAKHLQQVALSCYVHVLRQNFENVDSL